MALLHQLQARVRTDAAAVLGCDRETVQASPTSSRSVGLLPLTTPVPEPCVVAPQGRVPPRKRPLAAAGESRRTPATRWTAVGTPRQRRTSAAGRQNGLTPLGCACVPRSRRACLVLAAQEGAVPTGVGALTPFRCSDGATETPRYLTVRVTEEAGPVACLDPALGTTARPSSPAVALTRSHVLPAMDTASQA